MANNYLQPVNNHFDFHNGDDLEDVADDIFLSNSRVNSSSASGRSTNPFEDQQQVYAEKKRQIEERTLASTQKSLGLLYETEEVGKATAAELAKQREQLERTSRQLDDINSTLRFSQRHLNSLKSVFGGLKNYLSGNRDMPSQSSANASTPTGDNNSPSGGDDTANIPNNNMDATAMTTKPMMSPTERYDNHPISRIRENSSRIQMQEQQRQQRQNNPFESQLSANLDEMCDNLSRLKGLATDLGTEIVSQNELIDNMDYKIENVDVKINKQNKEMNKLLGKK